MQPLRRLFILLLAVALLPWGAFAHPAPHLAPQPDPIAAMAALIAVEDKLKQACAQIEAGAVPQGEAILLAPHQCKGPALPGSPCNPVPGVLPEPAQVPQGQGTCPLGLIRVQALSGRAPEPRLGPPRVC